MHGVHIKCLQLLSNLQVQHTENKRRHKNLYSDL